MPLPAIDISASMNSSSFELQQFSEIFHVAIQADDIPTLVFNLPSSIVPPGTEPAAAK